jgi:ABC-type amino acid transport substrate-binding protein
MATQSGLIEHIVAPSATDPSGQTDPNETSEFVPNPLCANNPFGPLGGAKDPAIGPPSSAALSQLSPSGTKLRIGLQTTNPHYATLINGVPAGPGIDISCRIGVKLKLPIEFTFYSDPTGLLVAFQNDQFEIGWAYDPSLAPAGLALTNPYVGVPNTYLVGIKSAFNVVADVDVPREPQVRVGAAQGLSPQVYLASHLKFAQLVIFTGTGSPAVAALLQGSIDAAASGRTALTNFANANKTKVRILPDNIFYANLAPFMHPNNADGVCYLTNYLEGAKASGQILQALSRTTPSVIAGGSIVAPAMPICAPVANCRDVTVPADGFCHGSASIDSGSSDDDNDADCTQSPAGPYALGKTKVTLTCKDRQSLLSSSCTATVSVVDKTPPVIACPANQTLECINEGAVATFTPTATDNCGVVWITCTPASGSKFAEDLSPTADICVAVDPSGNQAECDFQVQVLDTLPPVVTTNPGDANGFIASFWPPDHTYHTVSLAECIKEATDYCDGAAVTSKIIGVTSDEPVDINGSGHTGADIVLVDGSTVRLRAERAGRGDGRVYTIFAVVADDEGNATHVQCKVAVPNDRSGKPAVDSGPAYCVGTCK